jgi:glycosyltransferase involved in cell wall biosynthesis
VSHTEDPAQLRPFHLAVYSDSTVLGGAEVVLGRLLGALPEQIRVTVVGVDDEVVTWLRARRPGTHGMVLPAITGRSDLAGMVRTRAMLRRLHADVLQFNLSTGSSCQWAMLAACTIPGVHRIALEHSSMGVWSATSARLKRLVERGLDAHVAVGERTARLLEASSGLPDGTILTIHHGVPPVGQQPVDRPAEPTVLNVARHDPVKGVDVLLDAFALVPAPARLVLIGDGPETESLERRCEQLGLSGRVEFRGPSWQGVMAADVMWAFDVFVLPSRLEGFPVTVVEAMLAGVPIVATDVGSVREQLTDGETGWIVPPEQPAALAAAISEVLADPAEARRRAEAARADASARFTLDTTVQQWCGLYARVLG